MANSTVSLILHASALVFIYSLYSLLQEKIMKTPYGPAQERFTSASLLVLSNRLFSLCAGVGFSLFLPRASGEAVSVRGKLRPTWPVYSYAMVAAANFASTYCQYDALRFVGFTTQALAKCAKMVPVLILGRLFYRKSYKQKEYVAGGVVLLGCFSYLSSRPPTHSHTLAAQGEGNGISSLIGAALLCAYLFFDGLTSTTQEHYFGKTKRDAAPLTPGGPVLDQMVFVNLCASGISAVISLANLGTTLPSLRLAFSNQKLCIDVALLSATATFGLVVLYDTIFKHGALAVATTMTLRQFFSILLNAGIFGNFGLIGFGGWLGVGFVAAGVFIKMDRRFDLPKPAAALTAISVHGANEKHSTEGEGKLEAQKLLGGQPEHVPMYSEPEEAIESRMSWKRLGAQYGVPLCCPLVFALAASFLVV